jgi:hypothetical protein
MAKDALKEHLLVDMKSMDVKNEKDIWVETLSV